MGMLSTTQSFDTILVRFEDDICYIQIHRPEANNTINNRMIGEFSEVLSYCKEHVKIVVLEGLPDVFCFGADFNEIRGRAGNEQTVQVQNPEALYNWWLELAFGPFVTIAHVQGKVNAGGIGLVSACDLVLCSESAVFSLSELLFGLIPACVLPFLARRIGYSRANYMTLMTQPIGARQALEWGLVDDCGENSTNILRKKLTRLRCLGKTGISRYKHYIASLDATLIRSKPQALETNIEVFSDQENLRRISRYLDTGKFPWEED